MALADIIKKKKKDFEDMKPIEKKDMSAYVLDKNKPDAPKKGNKESVLELDMVLSSAKKKK